MKQNKEYLRGLRKGLKIVTKYYYRTQDGGFIEVINEFKELLGQKPIKKNPIKQSHKELKYKYKKWVNLY